MDIVTANQDLIVEARIKTTDIDKLQIGQATRIRLSAFTQTDVPEASGRILTSQPTRWRTTAPESLIKKPG